MQIINFMLHFPICINLQFRILKTYFSFLNKFYPNWTNFINSSSSFYLFPHTDTGDLLKANHTLSIVALGLSSNAHIQTEQSATIAELECSILILAATFVSHCGRWSGQWLQPAQAISLIRPLLWEYCWFEWNFWIGDWMKIYCWVMARDSPLL